jgi:hypothetical protein
MISLFTWPSINHVHGKFGTLRAVILETMEQTTYLPIYIYLTHLALHFSYHRHRRP